MENSAGTPEMNEVEFLYRVPGEGKKRKVFRDTHMGRLDAEVRRWLDSLEADVVVDFPSDYSLPEEV